MNPTEGTILTVMRICAERAVEAARKGEFQGDVVGFFAYLLRVANETLAITPELLPLLKEAGVVDAGGSGFVTVISGMLASLNDRPVAREKEEEPAAHTAADFEDFNTDDIRFAYCTEVIVDKDEAHRSENSAAEFKAFLSGIGDSMVFIEDEEIVKVHIHTNNPDQVIGGALALGSLSMVKIENMKKQHTALWNENEGQTPLKEMGCVSIAVGEGVTAAFRDLGVDVVVQGGQTMNPSTDDILAAIRAIRAKTVFVMPNNKNIFLVADRAAEMSEDKKVIVLPTSQFTQGIAAMMAYDESADAETNEQAMRAAAENVTTLSLTHAVRDAEIDGISIKDGEVLGLFNGKVKLAAENCKDAVKALLPALENPAFLTIYTGEEAKADEIAAIEEMLRAALPSAEVVTLSGGQPLYPFVIAAE